MTETTLCRGRVLMGEVEFDLYHPPRVWDTEDDICEYCQGDGFIEYTADGEHCENEVAGTKPCPECNFFDDTYAPPQE